MACFIFFSFVSGGGGGGRGKEEGPTDPLSLLVEAETKGGREGSQQMNGGEERLVFPPSASLVLCRMAPRHVIVVGTSTTSVYLTYAGSSSWFATYCSRYGNKFVACPQLSFLPSTCLAAY